MKILVVIPTFLPAVGGAEIGVYEIYRRLGLTHNVKILTPTLSKEIISQCAVNINNYPQENFFVTRYNDIFNISQIPLLRAFLPHFSISCAYATWKELRTFKPDIINFHYLPQNGLAILIIRILAKIPIVLSLVSRMDVFREDNKHFNRHPFYYKLISIVSTHIIANSNYYLKSVPQKISKTIIPYGANNNLFLNPQLHHAEIKELRQKYGISENQKVLFALQRLSAKKNIDFLLNTFKIVVQLNPNTTFIIGGKGKERSRLISLAKELGIIDKVVFTGYIKEKELPLHFAISDLFVFSSMNETFGIVLAQSLASGTPVISLNNTAIPEVIDHNKNGVLITHSDTHSFSRAVVDLLNNDTKRKQFSINAIEKADKCYNWDNIADKYNKIFQHAILR